MDAPAAKGEGAEGTAQKDAQHAWCNYLQALYLRASAGAAAWPKYAQCNAVTTSAAPGMLRQTADCSLRALQRFQGDPFTPEYAAEVSRCGSDALDAMAVSRAELLPYVATICGRMVTCGEADYAQCQQSLETGLGPHLERAIGAINSPGRAQLRACLKSVRCEDMGSQITSCLGPLMDKLLWLPG